MVSRQLRIDDDAAPGLVRWPGPYKRVVRAAAADATKSQVEVQDSALKAAGLAKTELLTETNCMLF